MPYGCSLFCRNVRMSGLSSTASTRNTCSSWRGVGTLVLAGITGAGGGAAATGLGATGAVGRGCIGASAMRAVMVEAAVGSEAASGEGIGTTRRFVRVADGATAAESADGDSGVTPLDTKPLRTG